MHVFQNEQGVCNVRNILAKFFISAGLRLIDGEMGFKKTDLNDALIIFNKYAAVSVNRC